MSEAKNEIGKYTITLFGAISAEPEKLEIVLPASALEAVERRKKWIKALEDLWIGRTGKNLKLLDEEINEFYQVGGGRRALDFETIKETGERIKANYKGE